jgi:hypothetical protein
MEVYISGMFKETMSIPSDVFNDVILSYAPMNVARYYRNVAPDTYTQRARQNNDRFSQFLAAIGSDDVELFNTVFNNGGNGWLNQFAIHVVLNIYSNPDARAVPSKILDELLSRDDQDTIYSHLWADYQFFVVNLGNSELINEVIRYLSKRRLTWYTSTDPLDETLLRRIERKSIDDAHPAEFGDELRQICCYLIRDLLFDSYPYSTFIKLTTNQHERLHAAYMNVLTKLSTHQQLDAFEEIRSLNGDGYEPYHRVDFVGLFFRRMWNLDWAYHWHEALNDPSNYPALVPLLVWRGPFTSEVMYEYIDTIGDSIVCPDLLVDAIFEYLKLEDLIGGLEERFAYFLVRRILGIPFGSNPFLPEFFADEEEEEIQSGLPLSTFNAKTKKMVARAILEWFPEKFILDGGNQVEHPYTRFYDQIVASAQ